jgi:hypothetical protein
MVGRQSLTYKHWRESQQHGSEVVDAQSRHQAAGDAQDEAQCNAASPSEIDHVNFALTMKSNISVY